MLGVRKFQNCQLDLWVGNKKDFFVDHLFETLTEFKDSKLSDYQNKHLAIASSEDLSFWSSVKTKLQGETRLPHRLTMICSDVKIYDLQQEKLFEIF